MQPATPAPRRSRGSRPERCHPVRAQRLAQAAKALDGESREPAARYESRPRQRVSRRQRDRDEANPQLRCCADDPA
jgi:hypothetical protein